MGMEAPKEHVRKLATSPGEAVHHELLSTLQDLAFSLETPHDALERISGSNLQIAVVRTACDSGLFEAISRSSEPMEVGTVSKEIRSSELLTYRLLRYLARFDLVKEAGEKRFAKTDKTVSFAAEAFKATVHHLYYLKALPQLQILAKHNFSFDLMGPIFQNLPNTLAESRYQDVNDNHKTSFNRAYHKNLPAFVWIQSQPQELANFAQYMTIQHSGMPDWLSIFPVEPKCVGWNTANSASAVLFVDIGGSLDYQCRAFREQYPALSGRIILQDLPQVVEQVPSSPAFEVMAHDFWQPQPIKGAKFYYLRNILHDNSDSKCHLLLQNIIEAMTTESLILIDEMVVPDYGIPRQAAQMDLLMMTSFSSLERTKQQWHQLLNQAGLEILEILTYTTSLQESIIVAKPII